ncbi:hypothetical protein C8R44DRAFT_563145, partial [Mycena epipterygia]
NCVWTRADGKALLLHLVDNIAAAGDGGNFKAKTFRGAAVVVEKLRSRGGPKTGKACANKYASFRKLYNVIVAIKAVSGWSWDDERGVDVSPATQGTWDAFVAAHPAAAQFRNAGWPFFNLMETLMPSAAKGTHV